MNACNSGKDIPFPTGDSEFAKPVTRPLTFSTPQPLRLKYISADSVQQPVTIPFDLDRLPSKPFTINDFKPLQSPMQTIRLDWDHLADSTINLELTPEKPLVFKKYLLPRPLVVKAGLPKVMPGTTSGVLQFGEEEALPGSIVTASLAVADGTIWLATNKGLCRYTGETLFIYSFLNKAPQGNDFPVNQMTMDEAGNIWLATAGDGIYRLNLKTNIVQHALPGLSFGDIFIDHTRMIWVTPYTGGPIIIDPQKGTFKKFATDVVSTICEDRQGNIWLGHVDHVSVLDSARKHVKKITQKDGLSGDVVLKFLEDYQGDMWVASWGSGIKAISIKNNTLKTINALNGLPGTIVEMVEDYQQRIWLLRRDTSYVLDKERTAMKQVVMDIKMLQDQYKGSSLIDTDGNIWIGSVNKGAIIVDSKGPLPENLTTENGLADNNVWGILEDRTGNIWLSTRNGVNIYDPKKNNIKWLGNQQGLQNNYVRGISEDDQGNVIIATVTGFSVVNSVRKTLTNYATLAHSTCQEVVPANADLLWVNAFKAILLYDLPNKSIKVLDKSNGLLSSINWDIQKTNDGNIWIGSDSGIIVINPANNTIQYLREAEGLCSNIIQKILVRADGTIWVATQKGIAVIDPVKLTITNFTAKEGLVPDAIYDLAEQHGLMYAGSSDGLIVIKKSPATSSNPERWNFTNYGKRQGFPYNDYNQNSGGALKNGQTWWGVAPVLTVVTQQPETDSAASTVAITRMNIMDESPSFFSYAAMAKQLNATDTVWDKTMDTFYLGNNMPKDSGYLFSHNIQWDSATSAFTMPLGLSLPHDQNSINFSFTNTDIKGRDKMAYRYVLEGHDEKWSSVTDKPFSKNYYNLSPGQYKLKVCTKGFNGRWSLPVECSFTIRSPWWQTWWAYLLYIAIAVFITTSYARYRSRQLRIKNSELENKISERTAELSKSLQDLQSTQKQLIQSEKMASLGELTAGIAHEIQNPLNFVNNFSEVSNELIDEMNDELNKGEIEEAKMIANDIKQNLAKINHHGKRADAIVKGMLQHSRSSAGQKEPTNLNALADEYLRLAYHGLRAKDKSFNATLKTDYDEAIGNIPIVPQDIGRVILNLINNAFYAVAEKKKQGTVGYEPTVSISTKKQGAGVIISVSDNGNGIPRKISDKIFQPFFTTKPTGQGTGLGLSLSYDIIKAHEGDIKMDTQENYGTIFTIFLPA